MCVCVRVCNSSCTGQTQTSTLSHKKPQRTKQNNRSWWNGFFTTDEWHLSSFLLSDSVSQLLRWSTCQTDNKDPPRAPQTRFTLTTAARSSYGTLMLVRYRYSSICSMYLCMFNWVLNVCGYKHGRRDTLSTMMFLVRVSVREENMAGQTIKQFKHKQIAFFFIAPYSNKGHCM